MSSLRDTTITEIGALLTNNDNQEISGLLFKALQEDTVTRTLFTDERFDVYFFPYVIERFNTVVPRLMMDYITDGIGEREQSHQWLLEI